MILVGSKAFEVFGYDIGTREDTDYIVTEGMEYPEGCDIIKVSESVYGELLKHAHPNGVLLPEALLTLKLSHLPWDNKWEKHSKHATGLMKRGTLAPNKHLYKVLKEHWEKDYGSKDFLSVSGSKEDFFDDKWVYYKYDHDRLHEMVAHNGVPVYTKCLEDGEDVKISKEKFDSLSFEDKVRMFKEEVMVIAIERWLVNPHWKGRVGILKAYKMALKKTITSLTKGWATDFMLFNLHHFTTPCYKSIYKCLDELEENVMSNVDLKEFQAKLSDALGFNNEDLELSGAILDLALGDSWFDFWLSDEMAQTLPKLDWEERVDKLNDLLEKSGYKHLIQEGGGEGGSEYCYGVFQLFGKTYKAEWSYYSHHGYEYDDIESTLREVKPIEKTITVYE